MPTVYLEIVEKAGAASVQDIFGSKVPIGKVLKITQLSFYQRVTASDLLPYETAKYQLIGLEDSGKYAVFRVRDLGTTDDAITPEGVIWCPEGWRPWAQSEATATTNTLHMVVNGLLYDVDELTSGEAKAL